MTDISTATSSSIRRCASIWTMAELCTTPMCAGSAPSRPAASISLEEASLLRTSIVDVLKEAIEARGTRFRDYRDARGQRGSFVEKLDVYARGGLACRRCGSKLVATHAVDGRGTTMC